MRSGRLALVETIEALQPQRVLVVGEGSLDILCALIRLGCEAASELRASERPDPHSADAVAAVMPRLRSNLEHLLSQARRALVPGGWMVLLVEGAAAHTRGQHGTLLLRRAGFVGVRVAAGAAATILLGRLPHHDDHAQGCA